MAKKSAGLGRGLAALLGEAGRPPDTDDAQTRAVAGPTSESAGAGAPANSSHEGEEIRDLPVSSVRPNPRQPRRTFDPEALAELARSIASTGIVQPIIVRPQPTGGYELIAGERRWRAAQMAGYTVVPAIVRDLTDVEGLEISLIENVVRQQLNPMDEAFALHVLLEDLGVTQESLAERIGKSRSALANKVRLLDLPSEVQSMIIEGGLSEGHGRALLGANSRAAQLKLARKAAKEGLSVRRVEAEVRRLSEATSEEQAAKAELPAGLAESLRDRIFEALEVIPKVRLSRDGQGGRIELPFRNQAELRRILERFGP